MTRYAVTIKLLNPDAKKSYTVYPTRKDAMDMVNKAIDDPDVMFVKVAVLSDTPA